MIEAQVGFLSKIAETLTKSKNNETNVLKSYYMMRCKEITRGYGLPEKYFNSKIRCPKCCIEWENDTQIKVSSIKLSKRQKKRLRSRKVTQNKKQCDAHRNLVTNCNKLEQTCFFCNKKMITNVLKPLKQKSETMVTLHETKVAMKEPPVNSIQQNANKKVNVRKSGTHVYANALNIFSMENKNNTLATSIKQKPKSINNNKKKKDKFAGLCEKAVLAMTKMKEQNKKENRLNLFLKPAS